MAGSKVRAAAMNPSSLPSLCAGLNQTSTPPSADLQIRSCMVYTAGRFEGLSAETRSNEIPLAAESEPTYFTLGKTLGLQMKQTKCFSTLSHRKSLPFYITLVQRVLNDISPGQLLNMVCFTCTHMQTRTRTDTRPDRLHATASSLSALSLSVQLPLVPFNILKQVKLFWGGIEQPAVRICPAHITTAVTCSDYNLHRDIISFEFEFNICILFTACITGDTEQRGLTSERLRF